jgi:hypothetical protein
VAKTLAVRRISLRTMACPKVESLLVKLVVNLYEDNPRRLKLFHEAAPADHARDSGAFRIGG